MENIFITEDQTAETPDGACEKFVFTHEGIKRYYKLESAPEGKNTKTIIAETFTSFLCKKLGVNCVDAKLAKVTVINDSGERRQTIGSMASTYLKEGDSDRNTLRKFQRFSGDPVSENYVSLDDIGYSFERILPWFKKFAEEVKDKKTVKFDENFERDLMHQIIISYAFGNTDLHLDNIEIIQKDLSETVLEYRVADLFDNGKSFGLQYDDYRLSLLQSDPNWAENYTKNATTCFTLKQDIAGDYNSTIGQFAPELAKKIYRDENGKPVTDKLAEDPIFILLNKLNNLNITKELTEFLCSYLEDSDKNSVLEEDLRPEEILPLFNKSTELDLQESHTKAIIDIFEARQLFINDTLNNIAPRFIQSEANKTQTEE